MCDNFELSISSTESVILMMRNVKAKAASIGKIVETVHMAALDAVQNTERMENHEEGKN